MTGSSNDLRYVYFVGKHRLAVDNGQHIQVYNTGGKLTSGFSSSDGKTLTFDTEDGSRKLSSLKLVLAALAAPTAACVPKANATDSSKWRRVALGRDGMLNVCHDA